MIKWKISPGMIDRRSQNHLVNPWIQIQYTEYSYICTSYITIYVFSNDNAINIWNKLKTIYNLILKLEEELKIKT